MRITDTNPETNPDINPDALDPVPIPGVSFTEAGGPARLGSAFRWFNLTQFLGAVNDNYFQQILIFALYALGWKLIDVMTLSGVVFALPYLLFLPAAGIVADRFSKQRITRIAKAVELGAMLLGMVGFLLMPAGMKDPVVMKRVVELILFVSLILLCTNGAFFNPTKYGILRELVQRKHLGKANGIVQACTYISIVLGFLVAASVSKLTGRNFLVLGSISVLVSVVGMVAAMRVPYTKPAGTTERISLFVFSDVWSTLRSIKADRYLLAAVIASAFFLMIAAFVKGYILPFGEDVRGWSPEKSTFIFLAAAAGIGLGSIWAGHLSKTGIEFGVVPFGAMLISIGALLMGLFPANIFLVVIYLAIIGIGAGLFIVPIEVFMQDRSPPEQLGQVLAAGTWLGFVGIVIAFVTMKVMDSVGIDPRSGFMIIAGLTMVVTGIALWKLPDFFTRFIILALTRTAYRIRTVGQENVPMDGPALLVSNHVSWADALVLMATQQRRVRFLMSKKILARAPRMGWLARLLRVIPVQGGDTREGLAESLAAARKALEEGYIVCVFAEGQVSRTGNMASFKSGFERLARETGVSIIPVYIGGVWGSISSYAHGKLFSRFPVKVPYPVTIVFGEPMPTDSTGFEVRQRVCELSTLYFNDKKACRKPMGAHLVRSLRKAQRYEINDTLSKTRLDGRKALIGTLVFQDAFQRRLDPHERYVGVLLPPSIAGVLTNFAMVIDRRVPININMTVGAAAVQSAIDQCGLKTVITSRKFLEKVREKFPSLPLPERCLYLEDLQKEIGPREKAVAAAKAWLAPTALLAPRIGFDADEVAVVLFSSGSTSEPKGIMLSHHNLISNIEAFQIMFRPEKDDNLCSALPLFHSFGFTIGMWFPVFADFGASYHVSPVDAKGIGAVVKKNKSTIFVATPTFLKMYFARVSAESFASLRIVLAGAEKLPPSLADKFHEKYGVRPLEGYGTTECAPSVAVNLPNRNIDGVRQRGTREGSVGQPLPGIAVRIEDLETGESCKPGESGMVLIKGPNTMLGYLNKPEKTAEVLRDEWYVSGDIGYLSPDGFLFLTGRLARFSKVGGEMVPHGAVEQVLQSGCETEDLVVAVAGVPDERKGEKLVVLHTDAVSEACLKKSLDESDLPNLWKPRIFGLVDKLPVLGTGKLDIRGLKALAEKLFGDGSM